MLVTGRPSSPQGMMVLKWVRLVETLRARPCMVIHRLIRTPSAQIFAS